MNSKAELLAMIEPIFLFLFLEYIIFFEAALLILALLVLTEDELYLIRIRSLYDAGWYLESEDSDDESTEWSWDWDDSDYSDFSEEE